MPHDTDGVVHWHEPKADEMAGFGKFERAPSNYDRFMESEGRSGSPRHRCAPRPGFAAWQMGAARRPRNLHPALRHRGSVGHVCGRKCREAARLNIEKHLYEKTVLVVEGRGTTEVWQDGSGKKQTFEWQQYSMFSIPLNARHRFVNASNAPALLLCGTSAPNIFNLIGDPKFVFDCPFVFDNVFSGGDEFFKQNEDIAPDKLRGLAMMRTNFMTDIANCDMPLDNRRSPGYRRLEPEFSGSEFYLWIGQHETGRYSKAHKHDSCAVLICLQGKGYTYTWPDRLGTTPWNDGRADEVMRQDYEPVGMVSAAPMSGDWFHQHFGVSKKPLRLTAWFGVNNHPARRPGRPGEKLTDFGAIDLARGGTAIPYFQEDPYIRKEFVETLAQEGVSSRMGDELYVKPADYPE